MKQPHALTDEQFADLLAGRPTAGTLTDLNGDASSKLELEQMKSALHSYRAETLVWAERRAATAQSLAPAARRRALLAAVPQWSLAAIAVATVAVGIGHFTSHGADDAAGISPVIAVAGTTPGRAAETDLASDNELLTSIDLAVSHGDLPAFDGLGLKSAPAERHHGNME